MDGGVRRGYCDTGNLKMAMPPAIVRTMEMTIAKRGRSMNVRENVLISSIDLRIEIFMRNYSLIGGTKLVVISSFSVGFTRAIFIPTPSFAVPDRTTVSPTQTPVTGTQPSKFSPTVTTRCSIVSSSLTTQMP